MCINAKIESLSDKLERMAAVFAAQSGKDKDDLYQDACLHLLERQAKDPEFESQNDSYILDAARKYVMRPTLRHSRVEERHAWQAGPVATWTTT